MRHAWIVVGLSLLLSGCSAVKFAYHQLEWAVPLYVESYVTLDDAQSALLKREVAELLRWHCRTQVTDYARQLRAINADFQDGRMTATRLAAHHARMLDSWQAIRSRAAPRLTELLASASDAQVDELFATLAKQNRKFKAKYVERAEGALRKHADDTMRERIEDWVGDLTPGQRRAVAAWSRTLPLNGVERLTLRELWQAKLREVLGARGDRVRLARGVRHLVEHPDQYWSTGYREKYERIRAQTLTLLVEIGATLETDQREHLAHEVDHWAGALSELACVASPTRDGATPAAPSHVRPAKAAGPQSVSLPGRG